MIHKKKGIFITATGTDVGKTYVTALILKKLREASVNAGYYKAALSGAYRNASRCCVCCLHIRFTCPA